MQAETPGRTAHERADPPPRAPGSARRMFTASVLISEVLVVLFATLVAYGLRAADPGLVWGVGGALMLLCMVATGLLSRPGGYAVGSVVQLLVIASGIAVPAMFVVGGVFAVLWVVSLRVGARIDVERQERYQAELRYHAGRTGEADSGTGERR